MTDFQQAMFSGDAVEVGIDYVEVPVLLHVDLPVLGGRVLPSQRGPGLRVAHRLLHRTLAADESRQDCDDLAAENVEDTPRDPERGLAIGAGFDLLVGSFGSVNIDARLTRGLSRLSIVDTAEQIRNDVISVMLGYRFGGVTR